MPTGNRRRCDLHRYLTWRFAPGSYGVEHDYRMKVRRLRDGSQSVTGWLDRSSRGARSDTWLVAAWRAAGGGAAGAAVVVLEVWEHPPGWLHSPPGWSWPCWAGCGSIG